MRQANESNWFKVWFDSKYYPILYRNRNTTEASKFLGALLEKINLTSTSRVLDLACGRGRHSVWLNKQGFSVMGVDLSKSSIADAKQYESDSLRFEVRDMRSPHGQGEFDAVFNLFTSFGYFDAISDNKKVLNAVFKCLKPGGVFILDYLNANQVIENLVHSESKTIDNIDFNIHRKAENNQIIKTIEINDGGNVLSYEERVTAFDSEQFKEMFEEAGFRIRAIYGNYDLAPYDSKNSNRLIHIVEKP